MPLSLVGILPVSAINIGLAASVTGITAQITKLTADISGLTVALAGQVQVAADPPSLAGLTLAVTAALDPVSIAASFNPATLVSASVDVSGSIAVDLGLVDAQLAVVVPLGDQLELGLSSGGIAGWSYAGNAAGFGAELARETATGYGRTAGADQVVGIIFATESPSSWGAFSLGFNTGPSATAQPGSDDAELAFMGELSGGQWNTGVLSLFAKLQLFIGELQGIKASLEASAQLALGLNLPDVQAQVDAGLAIVGELGIDGLLGNLSVHADIQGAIDGLNVEIQALLALSASLAVQLSAGGIVVWAYSGRADGLGSALALATTNGLPGGSGPRAVVYGLALAGSAPSMGAFGAITKTAA